MRKDLIKTATAGAAAGMINGLFGGGGGMVLVPLLTKIGVINEQDIFPSSICIVLPICMVSLCISAMHTPIPWHDAHPYLFGSVIGGLLAGKFGSKIPTIWLHRVLGILILWGGIRYLC